MKRTVGALAIIQTSPTPLTLTVPTASVLSERVSASTSC